MTSPSFLFYLFLVGAAALLLSIPSSSPQRLLPAVCLLPPNLHIQTIFVLWHVLYEQLVSFLLVFMNTAPIHASRRLLIETWFTEKCFSLHQVFISASLEICTLTILMIVWCETALFSPEVMKYFRHSENRANSLCKNVIVGLSSLVARG